MINEKLLKSEEKAVYTLRALYQKYGYMPFKMIKFEEYELYVRNKDFLISDRIIAFNDTNGKLLAMKPDVTLSIVKNADDKKGVKHKVCYNENVYRVSGNTNQFKEIMQSGIECFGDTDMYDIFEVVSLAAKSLASVSEDYVLDISHLGILDALLNEASDSEEFRIEALSHVAEKNRHDLMRVCEKHSVDSGAAERLIALVGTYGKPNEVLSELEAVCKSAETESALEELKTLCGLLEKTDIYDRISLDFSIVNNLNYYNGIVIKGFLSGICESVLTGGQYDNLMRKMSKKSRAVGFALYLDLLESLNSDVRDYDVDVIVLYSGDADVSKVNDAVSGLISEGKTVSVQKEIPEGLRYREVVKV